MCSLRGSSATRTTPDSVDHGRRCWEVGADRSATGRQALAPSAAAAVRYGRKPPCRLRQHGVTSARESHSANPHIANDSAEPIRSVEVKLMATDNRPIDTVNPTAAAELLRITASAWMAQAVSVAARLRLADLVADGARTAEDLASETGSHSSSLRRLLRALTGLGLFIGDEQSRFRLGPLGTALRSDVHGSVRGLCAMRGEPWFWDAWSGLLHSVKTGETGFRHLHGTDFFSFLDQHPEAAATFNAGMSSLSDTETEAVVATYDFGRATTVVDVGGGEGALLAAILRAFPHVRGVLLDLPDTVAGAPALLEAAGVADRCEVVAGSCFEEVPGGADLYLMKSVIHDWDDERAVAILHKCRQAMRDDARLLVIERVIPPDNALSFANLMDLNMLVLVGGRERSEAEYRELYARAGLQLIGAIPTRAEVSLLEGGLSK
jgi:O-methyltransferase domain/Dimerisation domain